MNSKSIIEVTPENAEQEGLFCIKNPKYPGFKLKLNWMKKRMNEGLKLKLLKKENETIGFIEYVSGEFAWRPVKASGYMFIHCIWVYPKKNYNQGYASLLIDDCIKEAQGNKLSGVAVVTSKGSWMADKNLFLKNGFKIAESKGRFDLLFKKFKDNPDPCFNNWEDEAANYNGLNLIYANQCPLFVKSINEMKETAIEHGLTLNIIEIKTAKEAQHAPSGYGVYNLVYNGKLLSDHYISNTRFKNILKKEI